MATVTNWDGDSRPKAVEVIGSYLPMSVCTVVPTATETAAGTLDVSFTNLVRIRGWNVTVDGNGANATVDAVITASGNTLTIADGGVTYDMAATDSIHICVWGETKC